MLYGIWFNDAGGSVSNVIVDHILQIQNPKSASCQTGRAIRADAVTAERTVTITSTVVRDYQKSGFEARGLDDHEPVGQHRGTTPSLARLDRAERRVVSWVRRARSPNNTIIGSGDQASGPGGGANGTAVLLFGANNVTVDHNTITGDGTDIGVSVSAGSNNITISFNQIGRTVADDTRPRRYRDRRRPSDLERNVDLQHLQRLEHEHRGRGPDLLHAAARRHRVRAVFG